MQLRNMRELAASVRAERKRLGLSQASLAEMAGVGRDWIIGLEKGKSTIEFGLVLRTLKTLGLSIRLEPTVKPSSAPTVDLDDLLGDSPGDAS